MAQWASSHDDEQQQGAGASNTLSNKQNGLSSNDAIPHPLMDCGQGKNKYNENNASATGRMSDEVRVVGVDVASGQDGERTSDGEDEATGNDSVEDVPKAIAGINYPIAGAPHPINKQLRLRTCESIPPPHGATPPSGGSKSVRFAPPPPYGATPPLGGSKSVRLASPPPYGAIPPLSGTMTVHRKSGSQPPPNGVGIPNATQALEGLQPPILKQTGGLLTGAETDKLRLQNRRRRHALQQQQVPTTMWSTHTGHASLPRARSSMSNPTSPNSLSKRRTNKEQLNASGQPRILQ